MPTSTWRATSPQTVSFRKTRNTFKAAFLNFFAQNFQKSMNFNLSFLEKNVKVNDDAAVAVTPLFFSTGSCFFSGRRAEGQKGGSCPLWADCQRLCRLSKNVYFFTLNECF